jgi:thioredoxin-like negative regulator of GroEL
LIESLLQAERLLVVGQVDAAEKIYSSTLAADPRNSIAVVGLARVALERGDDRLAYQHACEALEIDRQNAAALRLEARLSEVLATRGEPVQRPAWLATPSEQTPAEHESAKPPKRRGLLGRILRG